MPPKPSWEREKRDPTKYRFYDRKDELLVKRPGDIDGQSFVLRNCVGC